MAYSIFAYLDVAAAKSDNPELQRMLSACPWWKQPTDHNGTETFFVWIKPRIQGKGFSRLEPFLIMLREIKHLIVELSHDHDCLTDAEVFRQSLQELGYQDLIPLFKEY